MKNIPLHRDCMGATVSGLCLVHCIVWPLIPSLFPSLIPFLASVFLVPHDTLWESLHLIEYFFWSAAFLATVFSLKTLLKPHHCEVHHPSSGLGEPKDIPTVVRSSPQAPLTQGLAFKYLALACASLAWLWLIVVATLSLPHLYSLITSMLLIASHISAFLFSIKAKKVSPVSHQGTTL